MPPNTHPPNGANIIARSMEIKKQQAPRHSSTVDISGTGGAATTESTTSPATGLAYDNVS